MDGNIFIAPRLQGPRFDDHTLPVNILEDFSALEDLLIEIAKGIYLENNKNRQRVPKGFTDGVYLKLVNVDEGSSVPMFALASAMSLSSLQFDNHEHLAYFEQAKDKVINIIECVNNGQELNINDQNYLVYFNKIGKNLLENESIDFAYDVKNGISSKAILNKDSRKKILLSRRLKAEYSENIKIFALIPEIDKSTSKFTLETSDGKIECNLNDKIRDTVSNAFNEYESKTHVLVKGVALLGENDKIIRIEDIESIDILDQLDVSLRLHNLSKLEDNWYNGEGKSLSKVSLYNFDSLFNSYYNDKMPLPVIFPTPEGNIQLEWKVGNKNIIVDIYLENFKSEFFYYDSLNEDEFESVMNLEDKNDWEQLNKLIESKLYGG